MISSHEIGSDADIARRLNNARLSYGLFVTVT